MSSFTPFSSDGVFIVPTEADGTLTVRITGAVEMRDPGKVLNPYFISIDEEVLRLGIRQIDIDLRELSFMSSSGILTLVKWITLASTHANPYRMVLSYDRNVTWQKSSVPVLSKLAPTIVSLSEPAE